MAYDIGPKIGIEGEKEFKNSIKAVESQLKALGKELQTLSKEYDENDRSVEGAAKKQKSLQSAVDTTQKKIQLLTAQYQKQEAELQRLETALEGARKENGEGSDQALKAEAAYARQAKVVNDLEANLQTAKGQLADFTSQLENTANRATLAGDTLQAAGDQLETVGGKLSSVGNALTAGVTAPLVAAGTAAIGMASDYEESLNKVDVAFGDASQGVRDFAQTTVDQFGIAEGTALDMAALYGDMATSMEVPRDQAADMSETLVGLAGDLASFKNIGLEEASTALKGIFTGETESLKNLGVVMTETNLQAFALANGLLSTEKSAAQLQEESVALREAQDKYNTAVEKYGESSWQAEKAQLSLEEATEKASQAGEVQWDSLSESEKVMIRYQYVLAATKNAQGDYSRTSDGTANSLRTLQESSKELAVAFGQELLPEVTPLIQEGTQLIKTFSSLDQEQKQAAVRIAGVVAATGPAVKILGIATTGLGKLTKGVGSAVGDLGKLAQSGGKVTDSMGTLGKVLGTLGPKGMLIGGAVAGVAAVAIAVKNAHDDIVQAQIDQAFGDIKLSAEEVEDVAKRLTTTDWTVKVDAAIQAKEQVEQFQGEMESALEELNKLNWKVDVGLTLTEEEKSSYLSQMEAFTQSAGEYLSQQGYSISLALDATFGEGDATGDSLSQFSSTYLTKAQDKLTELGEELAQKVNDAFENNTFAQDRVDIQKILDQMSGIMTDIENAEQRAKLSNLQIEYTAGGFGIDQDSFNRLNEEISKNTQELMDSAEETKITALTAVEFQYQELLDNGAAQEFADKVRQDARAQIEAATAQNVGESINIGFNFAFSTITGTFEKELESEREKIYDLTSDFAGSFAEVFEQGGFELQNSFYKFEEMFPKLSGGAFSAVQDMLESLKPQKEQLQAIRDQCLAAGQAVPESVSEGLANISLWEAMVGNTDSMYAVLALQIASSPEKLEALEEAKNAGQAIPEELAAALEEYAGLVYDSNTGMWTQLETATNDNAAYVADMLNQYGQDFPHELAQGVAAQYGLVYENGKYMVSEAARGVRDNTGELKSQAADAASKATSAMDAEISGSTVGPPTIETPDSRIAWYNAQSFWNRNPLTAYVSYAPVGNRNGYAMYAEGGIVEEPQLAVIGEAGDEAVIPLENHRDRAIELWYEAGERLNAFAAEQGRARGEAIRESVIHQTTDNRREYHWEKGAVTIQTQATDGRQLYREFVREMDREVRGKEAAYGRTK